MALRPTSLRFTTWTVTSGIFCLGIWLRSVRGVISRFNGQSTSANLLSQVFTLVGCGHMCKLTMHGRRGKCAHNLLWLLSAEIQRWLPSQNGLLPDLPQRHKVTRFLISYFLPSDDSRSTPPLTQIGPLTFSSGSFAKLMDGSSRGSIGFPVVLSQTTNLPEGQLHAS
jgi:hypothetical protein